MLLVLIRHGHACGDSHKRETPPVDGYLTSNGLHQIETLRSYFSTVVFDRVYASSLGRAIQTSQVLNSAEGRIRIADWVRERGTCPPDVTKNPGESISEIQQRISEGWRSEVASLGSQVDAEGRVFAANPPPLKLAIVAHGGSLFHLLCVLLAIKPQEGYTPINFMNTGMAVVFWTPTWSIPGNHPNLWMAPPAPSGADLFNQVATETGTIATLMQGVKK